MATSQCPSEADLAAIAERGATDDLPESIRRHVESCASCKGWLEDAHRNDEFVVTVREAVHSGTSLLSLSGGTLTAERHMSGVGLAGDIPGYEIVREIHHGGQGVVYEGVQLSTKQRVAIKILREGPFASPAEHVRFEREVEILGQLKHPGIVAIYDSGVAGGQTYLVMDYIDGRTLDAYAANEKQSIASIVELFRSICEAVNAAHVRGVIHRDLKPNNIIVDDEGHPRVLDFGLAKTHADNRTATVTGHFVGALPWASPEQVADGRTGADIRSDVYALGVMLYQLLAGEFPYDVFDSVRGAVENILTAEPKPLRVLQRKIDEDLETIVLTCLRKDPEHRYQAAGDLGRDLARYLAGEPIAAKGESRLYVFRKQLRRYRAAVAVGAAFVALLVTATIMLWTRYEQERDQTAALRRSEYTNRIARAQDALNEGNIGLLREQLDLCPEELCGWEWDHLDYVSDSSLFTLNDHTTEVRQVATSPDGRWIASGDTDGTVMVWNAATGVMHSRLERHVTAIQAVAFSSDGTRLATSDAKGSVIVWDIASDRMESQLPPHPGVVSDIAWDPSSYKLVTGCGDGVVRVWAADLTTIKHALRMPAGPVDDVTFSPDGDRIVVTYHSGLILQWELASGQTRTIVQQEPIGTRLLDVHFESETFVTQYNRELRVHSLADGTVQQRATLRSVLGAAAAIIADGTAMVVHNGDSTLTVYDLITGRPLRTLLGHEGLVFDIAPLPNRRFVTASEDQTVKIWDPQSNRAPYSVGAPGSELYSIAYSEDGTTLAVAAGYGFDIWDPRTTAFVWRQESHELRVNSVAFLGNEGDLMTCGGDDVIKTWAIRSNAPTNETELFGDAAARGPFMGARGVGVDLQAGHAFAGDSMGMIYAWDVQTLQELAAWKAHDGPVADVALSPDGTLLATISEDGQVALWHAGSHKRIWHHHAHSGNGLCVAFDPSGRRLASGGGDRSIEMFAVVGGKLIRGFSGHIGPVNDIAFRSSGDRLASAGEDGTVRIWNTETGDMVAVLRRPGKRVNAVAFSPDGLQLAAVDTEGELTLWDSELPGDAVLAARKVAVRACEVVESLAERLTFQEDIVPAIEGDVTLDPAVRESALRLARSRSESASALETEAWYIVRFPGREMPELQRAVRLASRACELQPDHRGFWNTLGAAQYRVADYHAAVKSLTRAIEIKGSTNPSDFAFRAMALHHLERDEEAQADFAVLCDLMTQGDNPARGDRNANLLEASDLLGMTCGETTERP